MARPWGIFYWITMMATTQPDLSIVIVSWNVRELLRDCLASIDANRAGLALDVIVVDGASHDGSADMVREAFPWVRLVACDENVGFPRGNNIGMEMALGRDVLLLNPDTVVLDDALAKMVTFLNANPDVGAVGCQLLYPDGRIQSSRRRFPSVMTGLFESTWLQPLAPKRVLADYYVEDLADDETGDVDWVMGACIMVPHRVLDEVGGMDEDYFMYSEELDWCRRIRDAGYRVVYLPTAQVVHVEGASSEQAVTARHVNFQRAKLRYFRKYHGRDAAFFLRVVLLLNYLIQIGVEGVKGLLGHKRDLRWQRVRSYWEVVRTGLRPAGY